MGRTVHLPTLVNVGKYASPMDAMGFELLCLCVKLYICFSNELVPSSVSDRSFCKNMIS